MRPWGLPKFPRRDFGPYNGSHPDANGNVTDDVATGTGELPDVLGVVFGLGFQGGEKGRLGVVLGFGGVILHGFP